MRFEVSHFITLAIVAIAAWYIGKNVALPGEDTGD